MSFLIRIGQRNLITVICGQKVIHPFIQALRCLFCEQKCPEPGRAWPPAGFASCAQLGSPGQTSRAPDPRASRVCSPGVRPRSRQTWPVLPYRRIAHHYICLRFLPHFPRFCLHRCPDWVKPPPPRFFPAKPRKLAAQRLNEAAGPGGGWGAAARGALSSWRPSEERSPREPTAAPRGHLRAQVALCVAHPRRGCGSETAAAPTEPVSVCARSPRRAPRARASL